MSSSRVLTSFAAFVALPLTLTAQVPNAVPNDHRNRAGRMVDGVLHVELEAVLTDWRPRGADGPVLRAAAFAEVGGAPLVPGPMIRVPARTPVRVTFTNRMDVPFRVAGLGDRAGPPTADAQPGQPDFIQATTLQLEPGQTREVRFTAGDPMTSFYTGRVLDPSGAVDGAVFDGVFIVDPSGVPIDSTERIFMISGSGAEGAAPSIKLFMNGLSWPHTERLEYGVGETVRWRIINLSGADHPMHLHGDGVRWQRSSLGGD
jgi:FtsP/CotA-like multicopper oxidase with cupredoxin domain